jgi:hypothetical protein
MKGYEMLFGTKNSFSTPEKRANRKSRIAKKHMSGFDLPGAWFPSAILAIRTGMVALGNGISERNPA